MKTESKNPRIAKATKEKLVILSKYAVYDSKKSRFMKKQEDFFILFLRKFTNQL